jgi:hypothetical protein
MCACGFCRADTVRAVLSPRRLVVAVVLAASCSEATPPTRAVPASIEIVGAPAASAEVGSFAGNLTVRVRDAAGNPVSGIIVSFSVSQGGGRVDPRANTTMSDGSVTTAYTLGTTPGANVLAASVSGMAPMKTGTLTAVPAPPKNVTFSRRDLRLIAIQASASIAGVVRDSFGNGTGVGITWTSRNPALVTVSASSGSTTNVQVQSRPGQTYLVASAATGSAVDSVPVFVLDASSTECAFRASPTIIASGDAITLDANGMACIRSLDPGAEYALVTHLGTAASTSFVIVDALARGITSPAPSIAQSVLATSFSAAGFETELRRREAREIEPHVAGAREWYARRPAALVAPARVGDVADINVNAVEFCGSPDLRRARVAAITNTAVILADTENPSGGFSDAEYQALGVEMDTLVQPLATAVFGSPHDVDNNGRVVIFFTKAVNELTTRGSTSGVVLGFFYHRDLLPKLSTLGSCPGSNVSEMFYVLVPDTAGIASDRRSKPFVQNIVVSTIAHEYQHLVNASRRLYNPAAAATEEVWLNEGLSHLTEELLFYRVSGLQPRQNIGPQQLQIGASSRAAFDKYQSGNFSRYAQYLASPAFVSPISNDDALGTRGAAWAFLRYLADRAFRTDGDFWSLLVNSPLTGIRNVEAAMAAKGSDLSFLGTMADWAVSVFTDDQLQTASSFQQPSWNFFGGIPSVGMTFYLAPTVLTHGISNQVSIKAGGTAYMRFGVPQNQEALVQVAGASNTALPRALRLTIVRTK